MINKNSPHVRFIFIARDRFRNNIGTKKDSAMISFVKNVAIVASQTALCVFRFEDSSDM